MAAELKCRTCKYCVGGGNGSSPGRFWCKHPVAAKSVNAGGKPICRTPRRSDEFTIKRTPKWCPLKGE